jgi:2-polyprenyl-6-methoxyphenol hydroxylase-like FAD-dependent oxidoreductase
MKRLRVAVIGAGPAGLTAAIAGTKLGLDVRVYEQAADFQQVGGGLMLHRNGLRVLDALGELDAFAPALRLTRHIHLLTARGRVLSSSDLGEVPGPHNTAAVVLRYQLQEHLLAAVRRVGVAPEFGHRLDSVTTTGGTALSFADGAAVEADVVVAADGLHSRTRAVAGPPARKTPVGEAYLRAVSHVPTAASDIREVWAADGRRFGICPLPGGRTYFFCTAPLGRWPAVLAGGLADWVGSWDDFGDEVAALLRGVPDWGRVNYSELFEVRMRRWHRPPVFVIGDAAHAMTPNLGQGANQAMADALVLMRLLAEEPNLGEVARRHEAIRLRCARRVQAAANRVGRMARVTWPPARAARDALMRIGGRFGPARRSMLGVAAGTNPPEVEYLAPLATVSR